MFLVYMNSYCFGKRIVEILFSKSHGIISVINTRFDKYMVNCLLSLR